MKISEILAAIDAEIKRLEEARKLLSGPAKPEKNVVSSRPKKNYVVRKASKRKGASPGPKRSDGIIRIGGGTDDGGYGRENN